MSIWKIRRHSRLLPALLAVCLLTGCGAADRGGQSAAQSVSSVSSESGTLAQPEDFLPQNLAYGERPPASDLEGTELGQQLEKWKKWSYYKLRQKILGD